MTFDQKTGQVAIATKDGIETMDPADVLAYQLGAYKLGNGKVEDGIALMTSASGRNQKRINDALSAARDVIKTQVQAWKAGEDVKNDRARTAAYARGIANQATKAPREVPKDITDRMQAIEIQARDPSITPEQRTALEREYSMLSVRAAHSLGKTAGLRPAAALDERGVLDLAQKLSSDRGIPLAAAMLEVRQALTQGEPSERLGAALRNMNEGAGGFRPIPRTDVTRHTPMRQASGTRPEDLVRTSKRGVFGGVSYVYVDPATGEEFSAAERDQMMGGR
jgi:hypothetical protein